jgi:hypothetical protein
MCRGRQAGRADERSSALLDDACDATPRELRQSPQDTTTHYHEALYRSASDCCACLPCVVAEVSHACRYLGCLRDCRRSRYTPMERLLRSVSCVLFGWNSCYQGRFDPNQIMDQPRVTLRQVKHDVKAKLTQSATGTSGGEGSRNHVQVFANSGVASILILLHYWQLRSSGRYDYSYHLCWERHSDALVVGIVA